MDTALTLRNIQYPREEARVKNIVVVERDRVDRAVQKSGT